MQPLCAQGSRYFLFITLFAIGLNSISLHAQAQENTEIFAPNSIIETPLTKLDGSPIQAMAVKIVKQTDAIHIEVQSLAPPDTETLGASPTFSIELSVPQILSASVGVIIGQLVTHRLSGRLLYFEYPQINGILLQASAGLGGASASVEFESAIQAFFGYDIKAIVLKTFATSPLADPHSLYMGAVADLQYWLINFSLGVLRNTSSGGHTPWTITGGVGVRY